MDLLTPDGDVFVIMTLAAGKIDLPSWKEFTTIDLVLQLLVVLEVSSSLTSVIDPGCTVTVLELLFFQYCFCVSCKLDTRLEWSFCLLF